MTLTYGYDPSGDVTSIKDSLSGTRATGQGIATYVYDNALRLGTITQSLGGTAVAEVQNTYDAGGRLIDEYRTVSGTEVGTQITSSTLLAERHRAGDGESRSLASVAPSPGLRPTSPRGGEVNQTVFSGRAGPREPLIALAPTGREMG